VTFYSTGIGQRHIVVKAFNAEDAKIKARKALEETYGQEKAGLWLISKIKTGIRLPPDSKFQKLHFQEIDGKSG